MTIAQETREAGVDYRKKAEVDMHLAAAHISPLAALIAGVLILLVPRLLNYVVALYLIVVGIMGLNGIYHFVK
jgi:hypothetical protein